jgi:hypothetical protein
MWVDSSRILIAPTLSAETVAQRTLLGMMLSGVGRKQARRLMRKAAKAPKDAPRHYRPRESRRI